MQFLITILFVLIMPMKGFSETTDTAEYHPFDNDPKFDQYSCRSHMSAELRSHMKGLYEKVGKDKSILEQGKSDQYPRGFYIKEFNEFNKALDREALLMTAKNFASLKYITSSNEKDIKKLPGKVANTVCTYGCSSEKRKWLKGEIKKFVNNDLKKQQRLSLEKITEDLNTSLEGLNSILNYGENQFRQGDTVQWLIARKEYQNHYNELTQGFPGAFLLTKSLRKSGGSLDYYGERCSKSIECELKKRHSKKIHPGAVKAAINEVTQSILLRSQQFYGKKKGNYRFQKAKFLSFLRLAPNVVAEVLKKHPNMKSSKNFCNMTGVISKTDIENWQSYIHGELAWVGLAFMITPFLISSVSTGGSSAALTALILFSNGLTVGQIYQRLKRIRKQERMKSKAQHNLYIGALSSKDTKSLYSRIDKKISEEKTNIRDSLLFEAAGLLGAVAVLKLGGKVARPVYKSLGGKELVDMGVLTARSKVLSRLTPTFHKMGFQNSQEFVGWASKQSLKEQKKVFAKLYKKAYSKEQIAAVDVAQEVAEQLWVYSQSDFLKGYSRPDRPLYEY